MRSSPRWPTPICTGNFRARREVLRSTSTSRVAPWNCLMQFRKKDLVEGPKAQDVKTNNDDPANKRLGHDMAMGDQGEGDDAEDDLDFEPDVVKGAKKVGPKVFKVPKVMSKAEKEAHDCTHTPFHPGCKYCVRNRARNFAHKRARKKRGVERSVPRCPSSISSWRRPTAMRVPIRS